MKLDVLSKNPPWYAAGLKFSCTQCGNCCSGPPGHVWISNDEIAAISRLLQITPEETVDRYCRKIGEQVSLRETRYAQGQYDCIFLQEQPAAAPAGAEEVVHSKRVCAVYAARPMQCRTWPFWTGNLASPKIWEMAGERCPGMNRGKKYSLKQIREIEGATEWLK